MLIVTLIRLVHTLLLCENKGDKFYRSMRAADEKLIINDMGPNDHLDAKNCNSNIRIFYGKFRILVPHSNSKSKYSQAGAKWLVAIEAM